MELIRTFILMLLPTLAYILGGCLSIYLPTYSKVLDRKPFNCRPCLTFHLSWISAALIALLFNSISIFLIGVVYSFIIFFILYRIDKNKIVE